jgi:tetratricopeptide (TPR) repeat protein
MTFIGRQAEREELAERLASPARFVTVFGPPGVGKSAVAIAALSDAEVPYGYVDASAIATSDSLAAAILRAHQSVDCGGGRLRGAWILVDNAEHMLTPLRAMAASDRPFLPHLRLLVTSRELLALPDEWAFEIRPLSADESIQLLLHAARKTRQDFSFGAEVEAASRLIAPMHGIPLVITACAARLGLCGWRALARELAARPIGLLVPTRVHGARIGTMREALSWIFDSLGESERSALRRCSVFEGSFTTEAAESVLEVRADGAPIVDLLSMLRSKSLLSAWGREELPAETRLEVHAIVRAAASDLLPPEQDDRCLARHADYYAGELKRLSETPTDLDLPTYTFLAHESKNLFAIARRWVAAADGPSSGRSPSGHAADGPSSGRSPSGHAADGPSSGRSPSGHAAGSPAGLVQRAAQLTLRLEPVLWTETPAAETAQLFERLFVHAAHPETLSKKAIAELLLARAASSSVVVYEGARDDASLALAMARQQEDTPLEARARGRIGAILVDAGSIGQGVRELRRAVQLAQRRDRPLCGGVLIALSDAQREQGRLDEAAATLDRARERFTRAGDEHGLAIERLRRGLLMLRRGDPEAAGHDLQQALTALRSLGDRFAAAGSLGALARARLDQGDCREARSFFESARRQVRELGDLRLAYALTGQLGYALHELGDYDAAAECYLAALGKDGALRPVERAAMLGALGALRAIHGRLAEAEKHIAECRRGLRTLADPTVRVLPRLFRAHLDLARARATHSLDRVLPKLRRLLSARGEQDAPASSPQVRGVALVRSASLVECSVPHEDVRVAFRLLEQAMRIYEQPLAAGLGQTLTVSPEARSFRLGTGPTVDMRRRRSTRMLLGVLVRRRLEAPGTAVSCEELVELLWPDDRADRATVTSRLYVAILSLRRLGLGERIVGCPDGYLIDSRAPVAMSRA